MLRRNHILAAALLVVGGCAETAEEPPPPTPAPAALRAPPPFVRLPAQANVGLSDMPTDRLSEIVNGRGYVVRAAAADQGEAARARAPQAKAPTVPLSQATKYPAYQP